MNKYKKFSKNKTQDKQNKNRLKIKKIVKNRSQNRYQLRKIKMIKKRKLKK